jgi:hypothetical protein
MVHAESSARKFGGKAEDYIEIHDWFDQTKSHIPDNRHRAILHNSFGIFLCEQVFGHTITNSDGKEVSVRAIGEAHVLEDFNGKFIPTVNDYFNGMKYEPWMSAAPGTYPPSHDEIEKKRLSSYTKQTINFDDVRVD